jgi:3-phenylpropionate/cinnamic acid dioxygenase small subunit
MARNTLLEALDDDEFKEFLEELKETANYYVAKVTGQEDAMLLCIAKTWIKAKEAGRSEY